jgi:hypothetical protein
MPSKPKSQAAAERAQIRAELKTLAAAERKIRADWRAEQARLLAECKKADKALNAFMKRAGKQMPLALQKIERSRKILQGRL